MKKPTKPTCMHQGLAHTWESRGGSGRIRWIDRGIAVVGLAMIAASIAVVCVTWWDPAPFAMAAIASLLGLRWVLG